MTLLFAFLLSSYPLQDAPLEPHHMYLVRHGESTGRVPDENGIILTSGKSLSMPLTELGKRQAAILGAQLAQKLPAGTEIVICSSTALRAQETADQLFQELSNHFKCEQGGSYEGLCELGQGKWEGLPKDKEYDQELKKWKSLSPAEQFITPKVDTAETMSEVLARALPALQEIADRYQGKTIFVVSHYTTMNTLYLQWTGMASDLSTDRDSSLTFLPLENCDLLMVKILDHRIMNDAHLKMHICSQ